MMMLRVILVPLVPHQPVVILFVAEVLSGHHHLRYTSGKSLWPSLYSWHALFPFTFGCLKQQNKNSVGGGKDGPPSPRRSARNPRCRDQKEFTVSSHHTLLQLKVKVCIVVSILIHPLLETPFGEEDLNPVILRIRIFAQIFSCIHQHLLFPSL